MNKLTSFFSLIGGLLLFKTLKEKSPIGNYKGGYNKVLYYRKITGYFANKFDLPNHILLGIMMTESSGINYKESGSSGEVGLMQITPIGLSFTELPYTMGEMKDEKKNIEAGATHLKKDYDDFNDMTLAIMAYNISRRHLKEFDPENEQIKVGKNYFKKVYNHSRKILPMLLDSRIDDANDEKFIEFMKL